MSRTLEIETGKDIVQAPHAVKQANPPVRKSGCVNLKTRITLKGLRMYNAFGSGERRIPDIGNGPKRPLRYKICYRANLLKIITIMLKLQTMRYKICCRHNLLLSLG